MRQPYRNLFGSCLLAALILPSQPSAAAPMVETSGDVRTDPITSGRVNVDPQPAGIRGEDEATGGMSEGLREGVTTGGLVSPAREPILGLSLIHI